MDGALLNGVIRFDTNPTGIFYSGQVISGSVVFYLDRPIKFSVLYIQFLGEADVLWTESEIQTVHGVQKHKLVKNVGHEEYFNSTLQLAGGTGGVSHLPVGSQEFPFKFQIPFTAPSSFKGEQGEVCYSMSVHLIYADPMIPKEAMFKSFQVVAPFDLNLGSPKIRQPIEFEFDEIYGCGCFCNPDPVTIRIRLPVSGYCPGQVIPVEVQVTNESSIEITKMVFEILSRELYRSTNPSSEYIPPEKVLVTSKKSPVMAHSKRNFTCDIVVPDILPPYLENCSIIDVGYFIRVTIKMSGCNDKFQDEAEVCLGLVPVREFTAGEYKHPLADSLPIGPIPVSDGAPTLNVPPMAAGITGSNTSLQRIQYNNAQAAPYQNPPPYPGGNPPYPTENRYQTPVLTEQKPAPYPGGNPPYPTENRFQTSVLTEQKPAPYPGGNPPYPIENRSQTPVLTEQKPASYDIGFKLEGMPTGVPYPSNVVSPPYPTGNMSQGNNGPPPYSQVGFAPSAPPCTD